MEALSAVAQAGPSVPGGKGQEVAAIAFVILLILALIYYFFLYAPAEDLVAHSLRVPLNVAADEIHFWGRQLSEHALFLHLGIEEKNLKYRAWGLHQRWESFMGRFKPVSPDKIVLDAEDYKRLGDLRKLKLHEVAPLMKDLLAFKQEVSARLAKGEWLGWIFPLFVTHTIRELNFLHNKIFGQPMMLVEEVGFWNLTNGEHAAFAAHLLDPSKENQLLIDKADGFFKDFSALQPGEQATFMHLSLNYSEQLDMFNKSAQTAINSKTKPLKSVIHPVLIAHVIREGQRSIWALKRLGAQ